MAICSIMSLEMFKQPLLSNREMKLIWISMINPPFLMIKISLILKDPELSTEERQPSILGA
jgi:hypothetical protein